MFQDRMSQTQLNMSVPPLYALTGRLVRFTPGDLRSSGSTTPCETHSQGCIPDPVSENEHQNRTWVFLTTLPQEGFICG